MSANSELTQEDMKEGVIEAMKTDSDCAFWCNYFQLWPRLNLKIFAAEAEKKRKFRRLEEEYTELFEWYEETDIQKVVNEYVDDMQRRLREEWKNMSWWEKFTIFAQSSIFAAIVLFAVFGGIPLALLLAHIMI